MFNHSSEKRCSYTLFSFPFYLFYQVRVGHIADNGVVATNLLGTHRDRVHKLAIEPGSPHIFYSCGEDSLVQHVRQLYVPYLDVCWNK